MPRKIPALRVGVAAERTSSLITFEKTIPEILLRLSQKFAGQTWDLRGTVPRSVLPSGRRSVRVLWATNTFPVAGFASDSVCVDWCARVLVADQRFRVFDDGGLLELEG